MGLEIMFNKNIYICESNSLHKRWVVQAKDVESATRVVLTELKEHLKRIESMSPNRDIELDLRFILVEANVWEI